jgi:hypothetical protein
MAEFAGPSKLEANVKSDTHNYGLETKRQLRDSAPESIPQPPQEVSAFAGTKFVRSVRGSERM